MNVLFMVDREKKKNMIVFFMVNIEKRIWMFFLWWKEYYIKFSNLVIDILEEFD